MKLIKIVKNETYEKTNIRKSYYALKLENGNIIPIKPIFNKGYASLDLIKDGVVFEKKSEDVK